MKSKVISEENLLQAIEDWGHSTRSIALDETVVNLIMSTSKKHTIYVEKVKND